MSHLVSISGARENKLQAANIENHDGSALSEGLTQNVTT
jgi:hypothetical protein